MIVLFTNFVADIVLFSILLLVIHESYNFDVEIDKSANFVLSTHEFYNFVVEIDKSPNLAFVTLLLFKLFVFIARSAIYDDFIPALFDISFVVMLFNTIFCSFIVLGAIYYDVII